MTSRVLNWISSLLGAQRSPATHSRGAPTARLSSSVKKNATAIVHAFGDSADLIVRDFKIGPQSNLSATVIHIDGLVDRRLVLEGIIKPLIDDGNKPAGRPPTPRQAYQTAKNSLLTSATVTETDSLVETLNHVSSGVSVILIDGTARAMLCNVRGWEDRAIDEPTSEGAIRGPKDGFTETLRSNTALLRRRIKDPRLWIEEMQIGRLTRTVVALAYVKGVADDQIVEEARRRLERIEVDGILESGYLEEFIEDAPYSPFPQLIRTERPDRVAGNLLEGRIAILTDGTPFVLLAPVTFLQFLSTPEDYYERYFIGTFLRLLRLFAFFVSLTLPSLYIAITTFHQEFLPTALILSIAGQREGIPFPAFVEAALLEVAFEVLREAGVRLPKIIGPAISIVGVLVIGQAAVQAGLVSPFMVIIVAFTAIASFTTPIFSMAIAVRLARFVLMTLAASIGIFGIIAGLSVLLIQLSALRSLGVPYLAPLGPSVPTDLKDTLVRAPWWALGTRPRFVAQADKQRQSRGLRPGPAVTGNRRHRDKEGPE